MQNSHIQIRSAQFPFDAARIVEISGAVWSGSASAILEKEYGVIGKKPWQAWMAKDVLHWIQAPNAQAFVAVDKEEVVGFCSLQIDQERDVATVGYNGVAPSHQGCRIGSLMMDFIMKQIRKSGVGYAAVMVADNAEHAPARHLYKKAGFQTVYNLAYMFQKIQ